MIRNKDQTSFNKLLIFPIPNNNNRIKGKMKKNSNKLMNRNKKKKMMMLLICIAINRTLRKLEMERLSRYTNRK